MLWTFVILAFMIGLEGRAYDMNYHERSDGMVEGVEMSGILLKGDERG